MQISGKSAALVFSMGTLLTVLSQSQHTLDPFLVPRCLGLSFTLFASFGCLLLSRTAFQFQTDKISISYLLFITCTIASVAWAINSSEAIFSAGRDLLGFLTFLIVSHLLQSHRDYLLRTLNNLALVISLLSGFGVILEIILERSFSYQAVYTITGLHAHKNLLSSFTFLNTALVLLQPKEDTNRFRKTLIVLSVLFSVVLILFLRSKAVIAASVLTALLYLLLNSSKKNGTAKFLRSFPPLPITIIVPPLIVFVMPWVLESTLHSHLNQMLPAVYDQIEERIVLWQKTIQMIQEHWLGGVGAGNWQVAFPDQTLRGIWRAEDLNFTFQRPHNDLLWVFSESGCLALMAFVCLFFSAIEQGLRSASRSAKLAAIFLPAYLVIAFCDFPKERIEHLIWVNMLLAIASKSDNQEERTGRSRILLPGIGLVLSIGLTLLSLLRYRGEVFTRELYNAERQQQPAQAIKLGADAISCVYSLDPFSVPIAWHMGNAAVAQKNFSLAITLFADAYRKNPYSRNVLNDYASALVTAGRTEEGKKLYREANRISPRYDEPLLNLAAIYINEKNFEAAKFCLDSLKHDSERRTNYTKMLNAMRAGR